MGFVLFAGTTEGRKISGYLAENKICHDVCVATVSGEEVLERSEFVNIHVGRMDAEEIQTFLVEKNPELVIDATHPYAYVVTENVQKACDALGISYMRVERESQNIKDEIVRKHGYPSAEACAKALCKEAGNIFLSTGSKELKCYMQYPELADRIYVRVLPSIEAISLCKDAGIPEKHIIAMYGPHTSDVNEALFKQYHIRHLVTKESGQAGGYEEKIKAAAAADVTLHVLERAEKIAGISVQECMQQIEKRLGIKKKTSPALHVRLVGIGPGGKQLLTMEAMRAIAEADYLFGAKRMLESCDGEGITEPIYMPEQILARLEELLETEMSPSVNAAVLFSGDTGVYSGATKLYKELVNWGRCDSITILPGVSSFSTFAARIGVAYQDVRLESLHGKADDLENIQKIVRLVEEKENIFLLLSGKADFAVLEEILPEEFAGRIVIGSKLSYPEEQIVYTSADNLRQDTERLPDELLIVYVEAGQA